LGKSAGFGADNLEPFAGLALKDGFGGWLNLETGDLGVSTGLEVTDDFTASLGLDVAGLGKSAIFGTDGLIAFAGLRLEGDFGVSLNLGVTDGFIGSLDLVITGLGNSAGFGTDSFGVFADFGAADFGSSLGLGAAGLGAGDAGFRVDNLSDIISSRYFYSIRLKNFHTSIAVI